MRQKKSNTTFWKNTEYGQNKKCILFKKLADTSYMVKVNLNDD
jgi:hypothetical protein